MEFPVVGGSSWSCCVYKSQHTAYNRQLFKWSLIDFSTPHQSLGRLFKTDMDD